ncbi:L-lysine 6-transaminase [Albibacterium profundi]|uniref:L-lysine-epsilon aminotransferase n=1 Tax=Albibacterium profundi TaxID=3134906 RepID=A0ABV5CAS7_9SPHI
MYKLTVSPDQVKSVLSRHILADGYDLTFDMERSHGVYIYDSKNERELLDFFTCFASVPLGYNHPKMVNDDAFKKSLLLAALSNPSNSDVYTREFAEFLLTFSRVGIPSFMPHAFFISGGALAVENALKTAMDWKVQKNFKKGHKEEKGFKVLHFKHAFHGRSGYTLSLTNTLPDKTKWFAQFDWPRISSPEITFPLNEENLSNVKKLENITLNEIENAFEENKDDICAILIEPIISEGGDKHFRKEFLESLRKICDEKEALLIYDEVQTGVGLTGKFWCFEHFGPKARPDILAFGKKMQVCGILASERIDEVENNVFKVSSRINSTWGGNLADIVRSTKILQIIEEDSLVENSERMGKYLLEKLHNLADDFELISNVRGRGLLTAFDFSTKDIRDKFIKEALDQGALFLGCGDRSIRFRPALIVQEEDINRGLEIMRSVLPVLV